MNQKPGRLACLVALVVVCASLPVTGTSPRVRADEPSSSPALVIPDPFSDHEFKLPPVKRAPPVVKVHAEANGGRSIVQVMAATVDIAFDKTPLADVVTELRLQTGLNIVVNERRLQEAAVEMNTPVTINVRGISLRSALKLILHNLELASVDRQEYLLISTPDEIERHLGVRVYDCRDLLALAASKPSAIPAKSKMGPGDSQLAESTPAESLQEIVRSTVEMQSWDEVGGPAVVREYDGLLIVLQTDDGHEQVEHLLNMLHKAASVGEGSVKVVR